MLQISADFSGIFFKKNNHNIFYSGLYSQNLHNIKYNQYLFAVRSVFIRKEDKIYSL